MKVADKSKYIARVIDSAVEKFLETFGAVCI